MIGSGLLFDNPLVPPTVQSQDDKADNGPPPSPFVPHLFKVPQLAVGSFHMIIGSHLFGLRAVEERHHLVELLGVEHRQCLGQVWIRQVPRIFDQRRTTATGLMRTLLGVEQTVDLQHEASKRPRRWQVAKDSAQQASLPTIEVFGAGHDQVTMLPNEVRLLLLGLPLAFAAPLLVLARSAPTSLTPAFLGELASEPSQRIEDMGIDVLDDVEDAELMAGGGPDLSQDSWVKVRAVRDNHLGQEAVGSEVAQEASHVVLIVGRNEGEGDGKIAKWIGGQQQRSP